MSNLTSKISHGVYVLTTFSGGCIIDAVSQISGGEKPLISIAVNKSNYTNELVHQNNKIILSIVGKKTNSKIIETFGFNSMRDYNKFADVETMDVDGIKVPIDTLGYIELEIEDRIENETHTLLLCRYQNSRELNEGEELTYNYYLENKKEFVKEEAKKKGPAWVCPICGYVYYGKKLPDDFECPTCGVEATFFEKKEDE